MQVYIAETNSSTLIVALEHISSMNIIHYKVLHNQPNFPIKYNKTLNVNNIVIDGLLVPSSNIN